MTPLLKEQIHEFVQAWFDLLSEHAPVERLLPLLSNHDLEMVFPERTLRSHADFKDWYAWIGTLFVDQVHVLEQLESSEREGGIAVDVKVVWMATQRTSGKRLAARATQSWLLGSADQSARPVIVRYRIHSLDALDAPPASLAGAAQ